jgi:ribonuclease P protein component
MPGRAQPDQAGSSPPDRRFTFPRTARLSHRREYQAVYEAKVRASVGPLLVYGLPNELGYARLGLSVSRRVGSAVVRNRIKRKLREAFRLHRHDLVAGDRGYDFVITVRPHAPKPLADYVRYVQEAAQLLHRRWQKQAKPS